MKSTKKFKLDLDVSTPRATVHLTRTNTMPRGRTTSRSNRKRSRPSYTQSSSRSITKVSRAQVSGQAKTWPYQSPRTYRLCFDPFPAYHTATLRYSTTIDLNPTVGTVANHLFRTNSINDPDYTGVGHQPYGHDQYSAIYNHYRVVSAKITMTPTITGNGIFGISKTDDTTVALNMDLAREQKGTVCAPMANTNTANNTLMSYYYLSNQAVGADGVGANFGNNPSEQNFWQCWYSGENATADQSSKSFMVNIVYTVFMWELKEFGLS